MLRYCSHQAAGLLALGESRTVRLVAVVQHGDAQAELPFLWRLCLSCAELGYPVTVLDGTSVETDGMPGLLQRLTQEAPAGLKGKDWAVLPAKEGLAQLGFNDKDHQRGWHRLVRCFAHGEVVFLYSTAQCIASTLQGLDAPVFLPVSERRASLLTSYLALKRMLLVGGQSPTIVNVLAPNTDDDAPTAPTVCSSLVECAKNFLNFEAQVIAFTDSVEEHSVQAMHQLALNLLDPTKPQSLFSNERQRGVQTRWTGSGSMPTIARRTDVHR